ncbi:MAG TPA: bifunctional precorrin-2 dehydrogenase/sirohydrochlorin ferrochelatase [Dehalococcoidia bacterium]|nr:bifunctional precorrin-2 dehydrogenase/sirohydrochlorin ferrochelatase [Dehalococcoidia bacterium]
MSYYPIFLELQGRRCLVVGGGAVAEGKVQGLLAAGAALTLVAPSLTPALQDLARAGRVKHEPREYRDGDPEGFDVCFVATDDGAVNAQVAADCRRLGIWVNAADDPKNCDFILPSVVRQGDVVVAASTSGASPALARRLREELTAFLDEDYAPLADLLADVRTDLKNRGVVVDGETWQRAIDARFRALVAQRRIEEARDYLLLALGQAASSGAGS